MYNIVLFDLDGTLTDPGIGITNSVAYALKKYGIEVSDRETLYEFIGPPLHESFEKIYGFSKEQSKQAVNYYREYYKDKGIYENYVYDGIETLLKNLKAAGKMLLVATSKPEVYSKQILEHFNLAHYFSFIAGSNLDGTRTRKSEVINYALSSIKCSDFSQAVMIGDREHDIIGAEKIGIDSIGVLFGYGNYDELAAARATYIAGSVIDIQNIILGE